MTEIATLTLNPALDLTTSTAEVVPTHKLRCGPPRFDPGGGGINVARVAHELGGEVTAIFPCGGPIGAVLEALLRQAGVPIAPVAIAGETRESFTVDEEKSGTQYRFVLPGPELSAAEQAQLLDALAALPRRPAYVVASGSLPPGCDPAIFGALKARCDAIGARLVIDTSGPALAACEGVRPFLIKPSFSELAALAGGQVTDEAEQVPAARALIARGFAETVVVSLGDRGALLVTDAIERRFPAIPVEAKSGVGAGDSMIAAIVLALSRGAALPEAVRYGTAAGAAALASAGTQLVKREDVERLYAAAR